MTLDEAVKVVDELLTREAKAALLVRKGNGAHMHLTPIERRAIEKVLDRALERVEAVEQRRIPEVKWGTGERADVARLGGDPSL